MKTNTTILLFTFFSFLTFAQQSEDLIPKSAISVFSINNVNLLQKVSLNELVQYDFMEEVQAELIDGSTSGKTLKKSGVDFDQKFNIFFGKGEKFETSGFTFGVKNENELFEVFDDFEQFESPINGVEFYTSYSNTIAIKGDLAILYRVTPNSKYIEQIGDSIWYARGNAYPWYESEFDDHIEDVDAVFTEEMETPENTATPAENNLPIADEDPNTKTYFELLDSIELSLHKLFFEQVNATLFVNGDNLLANSPEFSKQIKHAVDGTFYFDNSRYNRKRPIHYLFPRWFRELEELYAGNIVLGDLIINDRSIDLKINALYNDKIGSIYQELSNSSFDKSVLNYIHKDNKGFITYNVNLHEAYDQALEIIRPLLLKQAEKRRTNEQLILLEIFDEFIDKDALFNAYQGSMFASYDGVKKVAVKKITYDYDNDTFEYAEKEESTEEDLPIFTFGFSSKSIAFTEKIMKLVSKTSNLLIHKKDKVWVIEKGMLNSIPLYILLTEDLFILTNNENLALEHFEGYGVNSLEKSLAKKAKSSSFLFGYADLGKTIDNLPVELFKRRELELLKSMQGRSGQIEFTANEINDNNAAFNLNYQFDGDERDATTYVLELINSLYVNFK